MRTQGKVVDDNQHEGKTISVVFKQWTPTPSVSLRYCLKFTNFWFEMSIF